METEQARHETEENLILAQFGKPHNISHKLQNGGKSSEEESAQIIGDTNWNHYKAGTRANVKRHRENCSSPASVQGLFDQAPYMMNGELMNGELKHALTNQSLLVHQPKKLKINSDTKGNDDMSSNLVDNFPELTKVAEFECTTPQTEIKLDKRNCNFPNGDIFSLPRNKQVSIPNGDVSPSSTIESTPGDLLEKTLSQYYPEQVSIAQQTSGPQLDAVNGSLEDNMPGEGAEPLSSNSGLPNSAQIPKSEQQQSGASTSIEGDNNYDSVNYVVNGYSKKIEANHQQQQQQQYHRQLPSYSNQELSLGQLPGMIPSTNTASSLQQHQNGPQCYPDDTNPNGIYPKTNQEVNQNSFLEQNTPLQVVDAGGYGSFSSSELQKMGKNEEHSSGQHQHHDSGHHYGIQPQTLKQNAGNPNGPDSIESMRPCLQQPCQPELENGTENTSQQRANLTCSTPHQRGWTELNASHSHQQPARGLSSQAQEQDMWGGFPAKRQQIANPHVHSQNMEPNPVQRFQTQGVFTNSGHGSNSFQQQQQDCIQVQTQCAPSQHNTAPEWQQSNSKALEINQAQPQKMPEQCNFPPNHQAGCNYSMQSEHLCEDPDLQDILSPEFLAAQQQPQQQQHCHLRRPLSHPPQFEGQQLQSPNYRPRSLPQPGQQQFQSNQPLRNKSAQSNNQHMSYNESTEMQQPQTHERHFSPNSGTSNLKQFQPQRPNNHCHQPNHTDISQTSTQSQPHLPQGTLIQQISPQMYPKAEQQMKISCTQFQKGPQLPLRPIGTHGDFQRHAALRMHLLQKQERQGPSHHPQSICDPKYGLGTMKLENGPRFELPGSQQQKQHLQMQEAGGIQVKQENQQLLCEQSKRQGSILATMEQSLRQYQLSPVFEKKSLVINSSNKVKMECSGPVTILSTNTDLSDRDSLAAGPANAALKKTPDSTPKKEHLLQSFIDSPMKLLDTPIKNLLDTPMKTQYDIASCHCVGKSQDVGPDI